MFVVLFATQLCSLSEPLCECIFLFFKELLDEFKCISTMADFVLRFERDLSKGTLVTIWLEDRVPTKGIVATRLYDLSIAATDESDWLGLWSLTESKGALGVCGSIFKILNHLPEALPTNSTKEVLTVKQERNYLDKDNLLRQVRYLHVWTRKSIIGVEAKRHILNEHRCVTLSCSELHLVLGDFLWRALDLHQVDAHVRHLVCFEKFTSHNRHELFKFFGVASDKSDWNFTARYHFLFLFINRFLGRCLLDHLAFCRLFCPRLRRLHCLCLAHISLYIKLL